MTNCEIKVSGDTLTIVVDLKKRNGISQSGNTVTIASTQGAAKIGKGDISVNLSVYTKEGLTKERLAAAKEAGHSTWEDFDAAKKAAK